MPRIEPRAFDDNFNQSLILHICISVVLFITYTLLKKYLKTSVLVKIIMPSNSDNSNESNILLELNSGFDSVLLYVCTTKGQLHQFKCGHRNNNTNKSLVLQYFEN